MTSSPFTDDQTEIIVALKEDGKPEDDKRRFKCAIKLVNKVDLESIVSFSKGEKQSEQNREETYTAVQAVSILLFVLYH